MERAEYGKKIVATLSQQLTEKYGNEYYLRNIRRMMQFAVQFPDFEKVSTVSTQLSWSHIIELLPLKTIEEKLYYAEEVNKGFLGVRDLRHLIARKAFFEEIMPICNSRGKAKSPLTLSKTPLF
jgi:hypothetical protein